MLANTKERFLEIYEDSIKREGSTELLRWLEDSDFFVAPASTKYHGCHEGGLLEHSLNVYDCLKTAISAAGVQDFYSDETVAIVSLLHDVCKVNFYKKGSEMSRMRRLANGIKKKCMRLTRNFLAETMQISRLSSFRTLSILSQRRFWQSEHTWAAGIRL